jgi:hypothetical protein
MAFYNTTNEKGEKLRRSHAKAITQDQRIFNIYNAERVPLTPYDIYIMMGDGTPITSIRRAINTLTAEDKLIKTNIKRKGMYGKLNYAWELRRNNGSATTNK